MRQIYSETPDFANLTSYVADYQSPFFQKSKTAENGALMVKAHPNLSKSKRK